MKINEFPRLNKQISIPNVTVAKSQLKPNTAEVLRFIFLQLFQSRNFN